MPAKPPITHYTRFHDYDYSRGAAMFLTFTLEPRRPLLGRKALGDRHPGELLQNDHRGEGAAVENA